MGGREIGERLRRHRPERSSESAGDWSRIEVSGAMAPGDSSDRGKRASAEVQRRPGGSLSSPSGSEIAAGPSEVGTGRRNGDRVAAGDRSSRSAYET